MALTEATKSMVEGRVATRVKEMREDVLRTILLWQRDVLAAACHGEKGIEGPATRLAGSDGLFGWDDPLRIVRIKKYPLLIWSMGARWPYATSIFDYVRRAMPHTAPKSLSDDQVYAVTAFLLHLNELVDANAVMDRQALPKVKMPAQGRSVSAWPKLAP